ncbi:DnaJ-domain-containing protein [Tribonema minus]|uniref:DnaJ-domain-containing protein n=1 Tax=Tribonema minus TaxID=303371 RepID=A0A836CIH1_9STRA|nr:DnaJ-domain-containing protein [Tribonema minus]
MNDVCTKVLKTAQAGDEGQADSLKSELADLIIYLTAEKDLVTVYFLQQIISLLNHEVPEGAHELQGPYAKAYNRIIASLTGTTWRIGKQEEQAGQERNSKQDPRARGEEAAAADSASGEGLSSTDGYYKRLGLTRSATAAEIKASFRSLAMKHHPDVSDAADAHDVFVELTTAYEVLGDPEMRHRYDVFGEKGIKGSGGGRAHADDVWDELEEWVRANRRPKKAGKRERARSQAGKIDRRAKWEGWDGVPERLRTGVAQFGDVVMYPLSEAAKADMQASTMCFNAGADGRDYGVGVVVGRNIDRGDVARIPTPTLELCEVEPLELVDGRWRADAICADAYPNLSYLQVLEVTLHEAGGVGESGGWYTLLDDWSELSPQAYHDEIIL